MKELLPYCRSFDIRMHSPQRVFMVLAFLTLFAPFWANGQGASRTLSGFVYSASLPTGIPGVAISVKGTSRGVITNAEGKFTIELSPSEDVLIFSFVGFAKKEVQAGERTSLQVALEEDVATLDEVVVVGYGEQRKINLTGAVETVRFDDAVNMPVTNSAQLLYGRFAGVQLTQSSGLPGSDGSSVLIRGVGTFGATTPLVIIDNIQYETLREFNNLAPSDIETITVLKDASASAIYGARGANGVIVVTTAKGQAGKLSVEYSNYFGIQQVTVVPEYFDAVQYAQLKNERDLNLNGAGSQLRYSDANIQAIINGTSPDQYANTNWAEVALRNAPIQNHYLSFSGGTEKMTFRASFGYLGQEAVVKGKFKTDRYTLSLNMTGKMNEWLGFSNVTNVYWNRFQGPTGGPGAITGETGIINQFQRSSPTIPVYYTNGELGFVDGSYQNVNFSFPINHVLETGNRGDYINDNVNISERLGVTATIIKGLTFETSGSAILNFGNTSDFSPRRTTRDWDGNIVNQSIVNNLQNSTSFDYRLMNENILRYAYESDEGHNLSVMGGYSVIYDRNDNFGGSVQGFPSDEIQEFDGGGVLNPSVSGGASEVAWRSLFGRINYNFNEKYLFEVNIRRDGSSKFGSQQRYGTFPSFGLGWNISQEGFMSSVTAVANLKLRATWGRSGNDRIGNYIYEQNYNTGLDYTLGNGVVVPAVAITSLANRGITWETIEQLDIGVDAAFLGNKLFFNADYFQRVSTDILYTNFPIPSSIGVTNLAAQNAAGMENKGVEMSLNYRSSVGKFKYSAGGNVTWMADNKVTNLGPGGEETITNLNIVRIGSPFRSYYGYRTMGIFQTPDEVAGAPVQFGSALTKPGDIRYEDVSGPDGTPDGVINAFDRVIIGNPYPRWTYNFNLNLEYGGFDMSAIFQGIGRVDRLLNSNGQLPMIDDRNNALSYWINRWTPENPSQELPRLGGVNNQLISDFYIEDASFLRLKNIEIGYSLPAAVLSRVKLQRVRFFVSGQNLLTFTKMKNFDPERGSGANTDQLTPLYKVYTAGLNLKF